MKRKSRSTGYPQKPNANKETAWENFGLSRETVRFAHRILTDR